MSGNKSSDFLANFKAIATERADLVKADKARRLAASKKEGHTLLSPTDVRGDYDMSRVLETTLGMPAGITRQLTKEDLEAIRKNIAAVQKNFKKGLTARQVINLSTEIDRQRAREQIKQAVLVRIDNGVAKFTTNASKESKALRHFVTVEFLAFSAAASAGRDTNKKMTDWVRKQPLKFECDCGRFTFWYRYLAIIGGYNLGRNETAFPKIRNPDLTGIACKHILRVMTEVENSSWVGSKLGDALEKALKHQFGKASTATNEKQAKAHLERTQGKESAIKTTDELKKERAVKQALTKAKPPQKLTNLSAQSDSLSLNATQLAFLRGQGLSEAQIQKFMALK